MTYPITVNLIPGLPEIPYIGGVGAWNAIVNHSTATPNATADAERNFESTHYNEAFVHYFVDDVKVEQVANTNYLSYGCGNGNSHGVVQIELCEFADPIRFKNAYDRYVWLTAYLLASKKLGVVDKQTVYSHKDAALKWGGSNHTDPIEFLASHGISWSQHIENLKAEYDRQTAPTATPATRKSYTVVAGDTFYGISQKTGVSIANLQKFNPRVDPTKLQVGDVIYLYAVPTSTPAQPQVIGTLTINMDGVNLRKSPSTSAAVERTLNKDESYKVYTYSNGWYGLGNEDYVSDLANVTFSKA